MLHDGCTSDTMFSRLGRSLSLTSLVALQTTNTCSMDSTKPWQRTHAGLRCGWSRDFLSLVRKSEVRNFRWSRNFFTSWDVLKFLSEG